MISFHLSELISAIEVVRADRLFVLTDTTTAQLCLPLLQQIGVDAPVISIGVSDEAKNLESLSQVWTALSEGGATRHSLLVNLGGGMVTDLGGFAASTFKRGMAFINVPTTLLSMVDASVGGKTGINFHGLKNEIGVFNEPQSVIIDTRFLRTLDTYNLRSGFAEMLKHGLISNVRHLSKLLRFDIVEPDLEAMSRLIAESVQVKADIVAQDPREQGLRKALNLGHTIGHALESLALAEKRPVLHGYAVAWGLVAELYMSVALCDFPTDMLRKIAHFIDEVYGRFAFTCKQYERLFELMTHDKKNTSGSINFTLLANVGDIRINQTATKELIFEALDFLREG